MHLYKVPWELRRGKKTQLEEFRSFTKEMKTKQDLDSLNEFSKQERGE